MGLKNRIPFRDLHVCSGRPQQTPCWLSIRGEEGGEGEHVRARAPCVRMEGRVPGPWQDPVQDRGPLRGRGAANEPHPAGDIPRESACQFATNEQPLWSVPGCPLGMFRSLPSARLPVCTAASGPSPTSAHPADHQSPTGAVPEPATPLCASCTLSTVVFIPHSGGSHLLGRDVEVTCLGGHPSPEPVRRPAARPCHRGPLPTGRLSFPPSAREVLTL